MSPIASQPLATPAQRRTAARLYGGFLEEKPDLSGEAEGLSVRIRWLAGPGPTLPDWLEALRRARDQPDRILKQSHINQVHLATLWGEQTVIKAFELARPAQRLRYRWRASRGRRSYAAARTLQQLGIPTPAPLGWVEWSRRGSPRTSLYLAHWLADAAPARRWIKAQAHRRGPAQREAFRHQLAESLLGLYRNGIYHADTKTSNLLLTEAEDPDRRHLHWIDLDCLQFGVRPTRRRVLRNLVQLNGSVGSKLTDEDRLAFLDDLAPAFPWLKDPALPEQIRIRTRERLQRELTGECGY